MLHDGPASRVETILALTLCLLARSRELAGAREGSASRRAGALAYQTAKSTVWQAGMRLRKWSSMPRPSPETRAAALSAAAARRAAGGQQGRGGGVAVGISSAHGKLASHYAADNP